MNHEKQPNVVLIVMDECKASSIGCYGNNDSYTPNIDEFSKNSITFMQAYSVFPKCVPARTALLTSRYPHTDGHRTLPGFEVRRDENNFVLEMKKHDYRTAMFGKNHTVQEDAFEIFFDEFQKHREGLDVPWERRDFEKDDNLFRAFYRGDFSDINSMADTIATNKAIDFITRNVDKKFFLLLNYNAPHPPYTDIKPYVDVIKKKNVKLPPKEDLNRLPDVIKMYRMVYNLEMLSDGDWRKVIEAYYSLISYVDDQIGELINHLKKLNIYDNTIIIITSDHGDFAGEHGCVEKWDTLFYDCLIRVPFIISCPRIKKGECKTEAMIETVDIAPTVLELCGFKVPSWMHGKSFVDVLHGETDFHKAEVFSEGGVEESALEKAVHYNSEEHKKRHPNYYWKQVLMIEYPWTICRSKMIRTKDWKLIYRINGTKELYDLKNDPNEFNDVSCVIKNTELINYLMEKLLKWCIQTETDYPIIEKLYS